MTYDLAFKMRPKTKEEIRKVLQDTADELNYGQPIDWDNPNQRKYYWSAFHGLARCSSTTDNKNASDIFCHNMTFGMIIEKRLRLEDLSYYYTDFVNLLGYDIILRGELLKSSGQAKIAATNQFSTYVAGVRLLINESPVIEGLLEPKRGTFYIVDPLVSNAISKEELYKRSYDLIVPHIKKENPDPTNPAVIVDSFYTFASF